MAHPLFSIGYANLPYFPEFIDLLNRHRIQAVADVRSQPYSKNNPDFSKKQLAVFLNRDNIHYVFLGREIGARREEADCYTENKIDYGKVASLPIFKQGLERLIFGSKKMRIVMLCAEKDPLRCHRGILISRKLKQAGHIVQHIHHSGELESQDRFEKRLIQWAGIQMGIFEDQLEAAYRKAAVNAA